MRVRRRSRIVTRDFDSLPRGFYDLVYLDPPWKYYGDPNKPGAAGKHYDLLLVEDIVRYSAAELIRRNGLVLMWATCPKLHLAFEVINAWGLHYRGVTKVWVKTRKDGVPINGQGVRPTTTKPTTEFLLAASKAPRGRPLPIFDEGQRQVVPEPRTGVHSEKPGVFRRELVELFGNVRRIELYARATFPGWDAWGNQVGEAK